MAVQLPNFSLPASTGQTLSLDSFREKVPIVMVFLGDLSGEGDHSLLTELDSHLKDFGSQRSQLLIVVRTTARAARELSDEKRLSVPLLADASGALARSLGAEDDDGKGRPVALVADKQGAIQRRFEPMPEDDPASTVDALLYSVRALGSRALSTPEE